MSIEENEEMASFRVFVSRIPSQWTVQIMKDHFSTLFEDTAGAEIFTSKVKKHVTRRGAGNICYAFKNDGKCDKGAACPFSHSTDAGGNEDEETKLGSGCVHFYTEAGMNAALEQSTLHVSHRTIKISPYVSTDEGRDTATCHAFKKFQCTHGDSCRFLHEGEGGCIVVGVPYQGRKFQCLSFKTKGKCSKGDQCSFLHTVVKTKSKAPDSETEKGKNNAGDESEKEKGVCHNFKKKGKCKRGDSCPFSHDLAAKSRASIEAPAVGKKRKIDGHALVEMRKLSKLGRVDAST